MNTEVTQHGTDSITPPQTSYSPKLYAKRQVYSKQINSAHSQMKSTILPQIAAFSPHSRSKRNMLSPQKSNQSSSFFTQRPY